MSGQRGQAVVGVLVVMALLFMLAAAISTAASAVLEQEGRSPDAVAVDLATQSAVAGSVARLTGPETSCDELSPPSQPRPGGPARPTNPPVVRTTPAFTIPLAPPSRGSSGKTADVYCVGVKNASRTPTRLAVPSNPGSRCTVVPLPSASAGHPLWLLLGALGWAQGAFVFVQDVQDGLAPSGCRTSPPADPRCRATLPTNARSLSQVAVLGLYCDLTGIVAPALYLSSGVPAREVYLADSDGTSQATCYLVEAGTGLNPADSPIQFEEAVVSVGGGPAQVRYEGPLT